MALAVPLADVYLYEPLGAARALLLFKGPEAVLSGPAGTGKSRGCLEKVHLCALKYDGMRALVVRKTRESLTNTALVTFENKVLPAGSTIKLHQGTQQYRYPNGSVVAVGGLDKPSKIMSSEWDLIYVQEATELTENDWESLTTRLRNGVMPYQQLIADCNPDAPTHWLKRRADAGRTLMLESRHEDNPAVTPEYLAILDALGGVRYQRLRLGRWVAAEGLVYDAWDRAVHLVRRFPPPRDWPRYWAVDFGYTNPFCWQEWVEDPDGRLYLHRELYRTQHLVEDHARRIVELLGAHTRPEGEGWVADWSRARDPLPVAIVCDHDAEDRATLARYLGLPTIGADKRVRVGIQAVQARLRPAGDGRARLYVMQDALVERDPARDEAKRPASTVEEFDGYVWATPAPRGAERTADELPVKRDDHGMDTMRYLVMYADERPEQGGAMSAVPSATDWSKPATW